MDTRTYFAQVTDGVVTNVHVVSQEFLDANPERYPGTWVQTFHNTAGKNYASAGWEYLPETENFRPQSPFVSWTWVNNYWNPPTPKPNEGRWLWNEEELVWVAI